MDGWMEELETVEEKQERSIIPRIHLQLRAGAGDKLGICLPFTQHHLLQTANMGDEKLITHDVHHAPCPAIYKNHRKYFP